MADKSVIMYDSAEAASIKTITGWVSSAGRFWGDNEHMARYDGCTHMKCKNNPDHPIVESRGYCKTCNDEYRQKQFIAYESKAWDGKSPVAIYDSEDYFFSIEDLFDHLCDNEIQVREVQLVHCSPNYARQIDPNEYYSDDLPEDMEVDSELQRAFDELNEIIKNCSPLSYGQDKFKVELSTEQLQEFDKHWQGVQEATERFENNYE